MARGASCKHSAPFPSAPDIIITNTTNLQRAFGFLQAEPAAQLGHASAFVATELNLSAVQSSCWYLDWDSQRLGQKMTTAWRYFQAEGEMLCLGGGPTFMSTLRTKAPEKQGQAAGPRLRARMNMAAAGEDAWKGSSP